MRSSYFRKLSRKVILVVNQSVYDLESSLLNFEPRTQNKNACKYKEKQLKVDSTYAARFVT